MGLKDKKSLYDRNQRLNAGANVGQNPPQSGDFFTDEGKTTSPFGVEKGLKSDQMVELLTSQINTTTGNVYKPSPNKSPFQDLDGADLDQYINNMPS